MSTDPTPTPDKLAETATRIRFYVIDQEERGGVIDFLAREYDAEDYLIREKHFATKEYAVSQLRMWEMENREPNQSDLTQLRAENAGLRDELKRANELLGRIEYIIDSKNQILKGSAFHDIITAHLNPKKTTL